jgi:ATP/maltotriose-dependent transcriptional regulator MalT
LYRLAWGYNDWLDGSRAHEIESRLARLASSTEDAAILASHRIAVALLHASDGVASRRDRAFGWLEEAERAAGNIEENQGDIERVQLARAELHIRYGEYVEADVVLRELGEAELPTETDEHGGRRWPLYWRSVVALRSGRLERAEDLGRRLLHTYRGDHLAATRAYAILTHVALLRGDADVAAVFLDAGRDAMQATGALRAEAFWYVPRSQVHIALGRPEVAVGQLQYAAESLAASQHLDDPAVEVPLWLGLGQAAAAVAERQRVLAEPRQDATRAVLRNVQRRISAHVDELNPIRRAEALRLFTRIALVCGKPRKALKFADAAVEALGASQAPVEVARCTEARGSALTRLERPEGRGMVEQALELYRHCGVAHPLVLEGWPVPAEAAMLKED